MTDKETRFNALAEEVDATLVEGEYIIRETKLKMYWLIGQAIFRYEGATRTAISRLPTVTNRSYDIINDAYRLFCKYPEFEDIPGGKNRTWSKIRESL